MPIGRLKRGTSALRPRVQMLDSEFLDGAQRERLRIRLQRFLDDRIGHDLAPLLAAASKAEAQPGFAGPLHRLTEALGVIPGADGDALPPPARAGLKAIGVKAGRFALFVPALLKPRAAAMRARLWACSTALVVPALPSPELVSLPRRRTGRTVSPMPWAGWRRDRCCCGSMSPSGSPRSSPGQLAVVPQPCPPAWHRVSR